MGGFRVRLVPAAPRLAGGVVGSCPPASASSHWNPTTVVLIGRCWTTWSRTSMPIGRCSRCPHASGNGACGEPRSRWQPTCAPGWMRAPASTSSSRRPSSIWPSFADWPEARSHRYPRSCTSTRTSWSTRTDTAPNGTSSFRSPTSPARSRLSAALSTRSGTCGSSSERSPSSSGSSRITIPSRWQNGSPRSPWSCTPRSTPARSTRHWATRECSGAPRGERVRIVWPHRWEHDKDPDAFFRAVSALAVEGLDFEVAVAGQAFSERPGVFDQAARVLGDRLVHFEEPTTREAYATLLASCDVAVSTALNEFFGIAMIESAYAGCFPLVPDRLAYPELYPAEMRYGSDDQLIARLRALVLERPRPRQARALAEAFTIERLAPVYAQMFDRVARANGPVGRRAP